MRVVIHFDERGEPTYYVEGGARLLIIDERAPNDRVYEFSNRSTAAEIDDLIGDDAVGSRFDGSSAARRLGQFGSN